MDSKTRIVIRGAGDIATGIAHRLYMAGFRNIIMLELPKPTTVRRTVSFSEAAFVGEYFVENVKAVLAKDISEAESIVSSGAIAVVTVPSEEFLKLYHPDIYIDAIVAKWNRGTTINDGDFVVGIGPGFTAGLDCHAVIETNRGHNLGRVIRKGCAEETAGIPGKVAGHSVDRIIRSSGVGIFRGTVNIGDEVKKDQIVGYVDLDEGGSRPIMAQMDGIVRGLLRDGVHVKENWKAGDVDARCEKSNCYSISDKARAIGGGALEAVCEYMSLK